MLNCAPKTRPKPLSHIRTLSSLPPEDSRSTSLENIWIEDEDYFPEELALSSGDQHEIITLPLPATLTERPFPRSIALSYEEEAPTPRQRRSYQRSLTALLPLRPLTNSLRPGRTPQRSPPQSPAKEKLDSDFVPTLTGDKDGQIKIEENLKGGLSGWFSGTSIPVTVGIPVGDFEESIKLPAPLKTSRSPSPEREPTKLRKRPTMPNMDLTAPNKSPSTKSSRFSFFGNSKSPAKHTSQIDCTLDDEFLNMDITAALFPSGSSDDHDPLSPCAFKNLVSNSESLFCKLQTAYKLRSLSLHELRAEMDVQTDELKEAETRAKNLKLQLEDMAFKMGEQYETMKQLVEELMVERLARAEEKEAQESSNNLVRFRGTLSTDSDSEHLQIELSQRRRPRRRSDGTSSSESYESDNESSASHPESVFSRKMSTKLGSVSEMSSPDISDAVIGIMASNPRHAQLSNAVRHPSTVRTVEKGMAENEERGDLGIGLEDCRRCRGGDARVAWDTVGLLKAENMELKAENRELKAKNRALKDRVEDLQKAVESTLDLVAGLGGS